MGTSSPSDCGRATPAITRNALGRAEDRRMAAHPDPPKSLTLTTNPKLDAAVQTGWEAWEQAARAAGASGVAAWLAGRAGEPALRQEALPVVDALLAADDPDERAQARIELAELVEGVDDLLADTLWE